MSKRITIGAVVALSCGVVLCACVGTIVKHPERVDAAILLEKRNPGYWDNLSDSHVKQYSVLKTTADLQDNPNLLIENAATRKADTYTITMNADGSFTFQGSNNTGNDLYYTISSQKLPDGDYYYSDGGDGASPSNDTILTYLQGVNFQVGGGTGYPISASMPGDGKFTADSTQANLYQVVIKIAAGASSADGVTFYPMISRSGSAAYSPAVSLQADAGGESYSYGVANVSADALRGLTSSDWEIFQNRVVNQKYDWATIALDGETGVELQDGKLFYGELDPLDRVESDSAEEVSVASLSSKLDEAAEQEQEKAQDIRNITDFSQYLTALNNPDYSVFISIRDDGISALTSDTREQLTALGLKLFDTSKSSGTSTDTRSMYRHSYVAVIDQGNVVFEEDNEDAAVSTEGALSDGTSYSARSLGWNAIQNANAAGEDSNSSIVLDGMNYCMNRRGMNFVVYDNARKTVIDNVDFDTCSGLTCYRTIGDVAGVEVQ